MLHKLLHDESGQGLVEYTLIIGLVAIVAFAALQNLGHTASNSLSRAVNLLP